MFLSILAVACGAPSASSSSQTSSSPERAAHTTEPTQELSLRFVEYIRAPREAVFAALTTAAQTRQFFHGTDVESELRAGATLVHRIGERVLIQGEIRELDAPNTLAYDFRFPEYEDAPTLATYTLAEAGPGITKLTITHEGFEGPTRTYRRVFDGWPPVLSGLKTLLETGSPLSIASFQTPQSGEAPADGVQLHFVSYIRATQAAIWNALTDPDQSEQYFHGTRIESTLETSSPIQYLAEDGSAMIEGEIIEANPVDRLVYAFQRGGSDDAPGTVTYTIENLGGGTSRFMVTHEFIAEDETYRLVRNGWPPVISGLKTLVETQERLAIQYD